MFVAWCRFLILVLEGDRHVLLSLRDLSTQWVVYLVLHMVLLATPDPCHCRGLYVVSQREKVIRQRQHGEVILGRDSHLEEGEVVTRFP